MREDGRTGGPAVSRTLRTVHRDAVPESMTGFEAVEHYGSHDISAEALSEMPDVTDEFAGRVTRIRLVSIRLPEQVLAELREMADGKGVAYQLLTRPGRWRAGTNVLPCDSLLPFATQWLRATSAFALPARPIRAAGPDEPGHLWVSEHQHVGAAGVLLLSESDRVTAR